MRGGRFRARQFGCRHPASCGSYSSSARNVSGLDSKVRRGMVVAATFFVATGVFFAAESAISGMCGGGAGAAGRLQCQVRVLRIPGPVCHNHSRRVLSPGDLFSGQLRVGLACQTLKQSDGPDPPGAERPRPARRGTAPSRPAREAPFGAAPAAGTLGSASSARAGMGGA